MTKNRILIANWKMKLDLKETKKLEEEMKEEFKSFDRGEIVLCPNFLSLCDSRKNLEGSNLKLGAQNVFWEETGSFTGGISASMLKEVGCEYVIIGHSERRKYQLENYEMIHKKVKSVIEIGGITPIICVGEQMADRESGKTDFVLIDQLQQALAGIDVMRDDKIIVAYEPVWAIGTGVPLEIKEAEYAHKIIKLALNDMFGMKTVNESFKIIYGASIGPDNVKDFVDLEIDGLLVGGASLDAKKFHKIAEVML